MSNKANNVEVKENNEYKKRSMTLWFKNLHRTTRIALVIALIASIAIVAYAANLLWYSATSSTNLTKEKYITVSLSGAEATGTTNQVILWHWLRC